jgi:hypothetical protein
MSDVVTARVNKALDPTAIKLSSFLFSFTLDPRRFLSSSVQVFLPSFPGGAVSKVFDID